MLVANAAREEFAEVSSQDPNAVLVGLAPECFDYEHMTAAMRLECIGVLLIATLFFLP